MQLLTSEAVGSTPATSTNYERQRACGCRKVLAGFLCLRAGVEPRARAPRFIAGVGQAATPQNNSRHLHHSER